MSFASDYEKLRKKRLEEEDKNYYKSTSNFAPISLSPLHPKNIEPSYKLSSNDDIAPVKKTEVNEKTEEKEEKRTWFQGGAFKDGYQFGDIAKTILGTATDLQANVTGGLIEIGENVIDAGAYVAGGVGKLLGNDRFARDTQEFIQRDLIDGEKIGSYTASYNNLLKLLNTDYDDVSVLGEKTDSLAQSGGQLLGTIGLQAVGVPWFVTTGVTSFGGSVGEAFDEGASYGEAGLSATISAGADILTEKLFGGSGLGEKGLINVDSLTKGISSKTVKALADFGIDIAAEGFEEVAAGIISNLGTALYKEEKLTDILFSEEAVDEYIESFIGGAVLGGVMNTGKAVDSVKTGKDYRTGLTENEQKVIDKEYESRIAESEKDGDKLTDKEKDKIYQEVVKDLDRGYISTDTIEEVLGGDSYKSYKDTVDNEDALLKEFAELGEMKKSDFTAKQDDRYNELKQKVAEIQSNDTRSQLKTKLSEEVFGLVKDSKLSESYNERARRGAAFEADLSKYGAKQQKVVQNAINSGILNNTNRTHEFVDMIAKISADKGVSFDFTNNAKLKESGFAIDGKSVNGYVTKDGVTVNIDSRKSLNSVVGHEITHVLEGTEIYSELQNALFAYAKTKGDYQGRYDALTELYKDIEGANVDAELTADLVGDYLFTDSDFIVNLSTNHRNVFQKIYDEIKYLFKIATTESREARELARVKKLFDKAYKDDSKAKTENAQYSLTGKTKDGIEVYETSQDIMSLTWNERKSKYLDVMKNEYRGRTAKFERNGHIYYAEFDQSSIRKPIYGDDRSSPNGAKALIKAGADGDVFDLVENSRYDGGKKNTKDHTNADYFDYFVKTVQIDGKVFDLVADVEKKYGVDGGFVYTLALRENKKIKASPTHGTPINGPVHNVGNASVESISQIDSNVNTKFSLSSDSDGKQLTKEQSEYFKDSKMRDENGNLKVMYHGSQDAGFHVFDGKYSDDDTSFFFVDRNDVAASYSGTTETYEAQTIHTAEDMNNFIESIGVEGYEVVEKDGKFTLLYEGDRVADSKTAKGIYEEFCWYEGVGEGDANYKVYLNLKNPLEIDAKGRPWNKIDAEFSQEVYDRYQSLTAEEKAALTDLAEWEDFRLFNSEIQEAEGNELASAYAKMGEDCNIYDLFSVAADNFSEDSMRENARKYLKTRDYAQRAKEGGYDGVIFKDIIDNGGYSNGSEGASTVAIAFSSEQIKSVANAKPTTNADIRYSLSADGETPYKYGNYNVTGEDVRFETAPVNEDVAPVGETVGDFMPDDSAPVTEEEANKLQGEILESLDDSDAPPETEAPYYGESEDIAPSDPFDNRDIKEVGDRKVKAYMYENPEVKPFFQEEANVMLGELQRTTRGERFYTETPDGQPGVYGAESYGTWTGTPRHTTPDIEYLLDTLGYSYSEIEAGLNAIIEDNGKENNACSKRIEFLLNDRLLNGYQTFDMDIPANQDYINLINEKQITEYSEEARKSFFDVADDYAPTVQEAPVTEPYEAIKPKNDTASEPKMKIKKDGDIAPTYETAKKSQIEGQRTMFAEGKTAEIYDTEPEAPKKQNRGWMKFRSNFLDKQSVFEDLSLKTKNRSLMAKANHMLSSESRAQWMIGKGVKSQNIKSLDSIRAEVESTGQTKDFYEYMYHKHNIDRMNLDTRYEDMENKPVFGDSVTAEVSQGLVDKYEAQHPEFKGYAEDVYSYMNHLRKQLVNHGVISEETANLWAEMYPHYVPIRRLGDSGLNINVPLDTGKTGVNAPIKRATGGSRDILPLFDTMAMRTEQTFKAIAKNSFGIELKNTLGTTIDSVATDLDNVIDSVDKHEELLQEGKNGQNPTFTVFENGERVTFEITEEMYDALKPTSKGLAYTNKAANKISNFHRGLLTEYNPVFMATNAIKDVQDILINSQHAAKTYAKLPKAFAELATKGKWYTEYMENGGEHNTYFDNQTNTFVEKDKGLKKLFKGISKANNFVERLPRLAEYIASRESGADIETAMLDASRVTTNFAAGGDVTKFLNRNGATFLNASVQGFNQQVRNIREAKANGLKGVLTLASKFAIAGLSANILNHLLWEDDEEYEELSDYVKDNYYIVAKNDDGQFIRIPKGRTVAVIQNAFEQMNNFITGDDEVDLQKFGELLISNLAPNNPIDNNIFAPIKQVLDNKTWYGEDLVPTRLQDLPAAEQFDESTDAISKWLGEKFDVSPYKINYLIDQYSGGIGDVFLPMMTPEAERGDDSFLGNVIAPFKDKFTTDGTMNNQNVSDFYDTVDELTTNAKSSKATDEDLLKYKYMNSVNAELGELYAQKREIQNSDLSGAEKYNAVREIQEQIVSLTRDSLNTYENVKMGEGYASIGDKHFRLNDDGEWQKISDEQLEKQNEVTKNLGISAEEYWGNKEEYDYAYKNPEKYKVAKAVGGYKAYKTYSSELYDIKADKDENGKSITGSRKEKVIDYINNLDADYGEKIILFKSEYNADDTYNYEIIDYLNGREDISYEEMETILKELGFTVDSEGNIYWD